MNDGTYISREEYVNLIENDQSFGFVIGALRNAARLNYSGKALSFDDDIVDTVFKIVLPDTYKKTFEKLRAEQENDE